jgi:hypothetical protein
MIVWAVFLCIVPVHSCQMVGAPRVDISGNNIPGQFFSTKAECERAKPSFTHPDKSEYYTCLSKHVDAWR